MDKYLHIYREYKMEIDQEYELVCEMQMDKE